MYNPPKNDNALQNRTSHYQSLRNKRPFENTDSYENKMRENRLDPRLFSVYKIAEEPKGPAPIPLLYVQNGYVSQGYIETVINYI